MNTRETLDIVGQLTVQKYDLDGQLVEEISQHNDITLDGRKLVARLFNPKLVEADDDKIKRISSIHLGESNRAFKNNQNGLVQPVGQTPISSIDEIVKDGSRIVLRIVGELDENNCNGTLREAGLFTDDETPLMYNRVVFPPISKTDQFKLTLIWEITF